MTTSKKPSGTLVSTETEAAVEPDATSTKVLERPLSVRAAREASKARTAAKKEAKLKAERQARRAQAKREKELQSLEAKVRLKKHRVKKHKANLEKLAEATSTDSSSVLTPTDLEEAPEGVKEVIEDQYVAFRPNPGKQEEFLSSPEKEVLYGGAAGGGKSYAMLADLLRYVHVPGYRALLLRRTLDELTELIDKSKDFYPKAFPGAHFVEGKKTWKFPSGATALFSYCERDDDVRRYQGQAFAWIGIDELTHYPTPYVWNYLRSRLRTTITGVRTYMRATTNPGGQGTWWVKKMFIDPAPWGQPFWARDIDSGKILRYGERHPKANQPLFQRRFIPARLPDNPHLYEDTDYETMLMSLPEVERKRLLDGDWDVTDGAVFEEFDRAIHVVEPFTIPHNWTRVRAGDYGYASPSCVLWGAIDWDSNLWIYRELYEKGLNAEALAHKVQDLEVQDPQMGAYVLDPACWNRTGLGPSIAETMIQSGTVWTRADHNRIPGKVEVHRRLALNEVGDPRLRIFDSCSHLISTLPMLPYSKTIVEDVDTKADDHAYDALRYMVMSRPTSPYVVSREFDQLDKSEPEPYDSTFGW